MRYIVIGMAAVRLSWQWLHYINTLEIWNENNDKIRYDKQNKMLFLAVYKHHLTQIVHYQFLLVQDFVDRILIHLKQNWTVNTT